MNNNPDKKKFSFKNLSKAKKLFLVFDAVVIFTLLISGVITLNLRANSDNNQMYIVSFNSVGGSIIEEQVVPKDGKAIKPTDPKKDGYLFPVYVFDAPKLIYDWIESIAPEQIGDKIAVRSVSGGGDMIANVSCRKSCCDILESKGFNVFYDRMLVMPANVFIKYSDDLIMHLVNAIPEKVNEIVNDLMDERESRTNSKKGAFSKWLFKTAQKNFSGFAKSYKVTDDCNLCGWCVDNCPKNNILANDTLGKVVFKDDCAVCLRCIYGCPMKAITLKGIFVLKSGYDLNDVINRMKDVDLIPVEECCKGFMYKGVKKYLLDKS